jgi:hypothetical protein
VVGACSDGGVTGHHLAQLNIGRIRAPIDSPAMAGFTSMLDTVNALADGSPGFVWRLQDGDGPGATALRPCGPNVIVNLSVWQTLEALRSFVYRGRAHLDLMRRRREWFQPMPQHYLVLWWIPAGQIPDVSQALDRLDLLRREGPGPRAFTFRDPYDRPPARDREQAPDPESATVAGVCCWRPECAVGGRASRPGRGSSRSGRPAPRAWRRAA